MGKGLINHSTVNRKGHFDRDVRGAINPYGRGCMTSSITITGSSLSSNDKSRPVTALHVLITPSH
jgi:hypothetical protein